jgi:hypothetical protein
MESTIVQRAELQANRSHAAPREQVPAPIRARILAATRTSPPADTGLSHWSSREMAAFISEPRVGGFNRS